MIFIGAQKIIQGEVIKSEIQDDPKAGFMQGYYYIRDKNQNTVKVFVKNENLICWLNKKLFLTPPDCILGIDPFSLRGVHNSEMKEGQAIVLAAKKAAEIWRSRKGRSVFNPKALGFDLPVCSIG